MRGTTAEMPLVDNLLLLLLFIIIIIIIVVIVGGGVTVVVFNYFFNFYNDYHFYCPYDYNNNYYNYNVIIT